MFILYYIYPSQLLDQLLEFFVSNEDDEVSTSPGIHFDLDKSYSVARWGLLFSKSLLNVAMFNYYLYQVSCLQYQNLYQIANVTNAFGLLFLQSGGQVHYVINVWYWVLTLLPYSEALAGATESLGKLSEIHNTLVETYSAKLKDKDSKKWVLEVSCWKMFLYCNVIIVLSFFNLVNRGCLHNAIWFINLRISERALIQFSRDCRLSSILKGL